MPSARELLDDTWYGLAGLFMGVCGFTIVVTAVSIAFGFSVLIIGLPVAVLAAKLDRWWCTLERRRAAPILGDPIAARFRAATGETRIGRALSILRDRQTYLDAAWMVVSLPLGIVTFTIAVTAWSTTVGLLAMPLYAWSMPGWIGRHAVFCSLAGPVLAVPVAWLSAWVVHGNARIYADGAARLLGGGRTAALEARVESLTETRAGVVDAATQELQRVERDLHDGAQARLVALAMDLGMAEQRLTEADPATAREHVASARGQAQAAMAELRDLVRGIGPSILHDHGLDAALTALASGRTPPVELRVDGAGSEHGTRAAAAYFVVAEALANARKHAQASRVSVHVHLDAAERLVAEVTDDGVGGADLQAGTGLSGLHKRVAAVDGTLDVVSPPGGPTTVRAVLP
jgi:signal transduction histidine kinase